MNMRKVIGRIGFGSTCLLILVGMSFADVCPGFLPANSLSIPVPGPAAQQTGIDEATFNEALDKFEAVAKKLLQNSRGRLLLSRRWTDGAVNASAQQVGSFWLINMYGGLARFPGMTRDGFLFVACHELGHHLGGAPKAAPILGVKNWATNEGGADYYAGLKCLRHVFADEDNKTIVAGLTVSPVADQVCRKMFPAAQDENLMWTCMRTSVAAEKLGEVMRKVLEARDGKVLPSTSLDTPDPNIVAQTDDGHPAPQCRVDTYFAGAACPADYQIDPSDTDPEVGACSDGLPFVSRPRCWYKPPAKRTPELQVRLDRGESPDAMIWFRERADLNSADLNAVGPQRETRIAEVYRRLVLTASSSQARVIQHLKLRQAVFRPYHIANTIRVSQISENLIEELERFPEVVRISPDYQNTLTLPEAQDPKRVAPLGVESPIRDSGAEQVWTKLGAKGAGIVIGSADSGVEWNHPAIRKQYRGSLPLFVSHDYNWHDAISTTGSSRCQAKSTEPCDDTGHGTHTVGTMVGDDGQGNQIGMAPDAKWIGCRNMNKGTGTLSSYLECFEFFLAPYPVGGDPRADGRPDLAPHIVNNSWSCPTSEGCRREDLVDSVRVMKAAGIAMVVAAGNDGDTCGSLQDPPGTYSGDVISVAAYNRYRKEAAYFSSRGPSGFHGGVGIDITAHGVGIRSSVLGGKYDEKDGTSMAAPIVSGALALLWSYRSNLIGDVDQTRQLLLSTAKPMKSGQSCGGYSGQSSPNTTYGHGMLDALKLLETN